MQKQNRSRIIGLRFTQQEYENLKTKSAQTTTPQISTFIRKMLFGKPITVKQRNQSLDDCMAELMRLRTELNRIGHNFNQAAKRLHTLVQLYEFRDWLTSYDKDRILLFNKIDAIEKKMNTISDAWLQ